MTFFSCLGVRALRGVSFLALTVPLMLADGKAEQAQPGPLAHISPVSDSALEHPAPGDWLMRRGNYAGWGYSKLDQIRADNVARLRLAWAWTMEPGYQQEAPLAHDGVVFLGNPRNVVQALDGRTGELLWQYRRELPPVEGRYHQDLFDRQRASIALYEDKVFLTTADAHVIALDSKTGKVVWDTVVADYRQGYTFTGGPIVVKGKVIAGMSGCTMPTTHGGCFIVALDAHNGRELWRTHTVAQPGSAGDATWNGLPLARRNGGSAWNTGSYDPTSNLLFWGVDGPTPHSQVARGTGNGAVLYTESTLAMDADTGQIKWYHQFLPDDNWNLDHTFEQVLADVSIEGRAREALLAIGKPGILWALDRRNGAFLWARETTYENVERVNPVSGDISVNQTLIPQQLDQTVFVCPSMYGGKLWMASAFDPVAKAHFLPLNNLCMDYKAVAQEELPGEDYGRGRMQFRFAPGSNGKVGRVEAIDISSRKTLWIHERRPFWSSSLLVTAGGLVIGGDANRHVVALEARSGRVLWELALSNQPGGFPMTYLAGGKQFLAIPAGYSLIGNRVTSSLTSEIPVPARGSTLWVFALPETERQ
ncbi:MAG: PQQ-binding-like beta-propeller repeat protein [Acetobacteraceae bacterium]|nr:PQQ-binding-like beta-propeller repeat protein [Acetobacteraceae bacterium]